MIRKPQALSRHDHAVEGNAVPKVITEGDGTAQDSPVGAEVLEQGREAHIEPEMRRAQRPAGELAEVKGIPERHGGLRILEDRFRDCRPRQQGIDRRTQRAVVARMAQK